MRQDRPLRHLRQQDGAGFEHEPRTLRPIGRDGRARCPASPAPRSSRAARARRCAWSSRGSSGRRSCATTITPMSPSTDGLMRKPNFRPRARLVEQVLRAKQLVLVPVDRNQRRRLGQRRRGVLVADDAHDAAAAPERLHQEHADGRDDLPDEATHRSHPTLRPGLLLIEGVAQSACVFGIGWHPVGAGKRGANCR